MTDALNIALSGLHANSTRLGVAANNIANLRSSGRVDDPQTAYQPQHAVDVSAGGGGVRTEVQPVTPATTPVYDPSDANANADGLVAMPNVSLENELVDSMMAVTGYKANASVIHTLAAMDHALLDIKV